MLDQARGDAIEQPGGCCPSPCSIGVFWASEGGNAAGPGLRAMSWGAAW
jgi:hypothetical protein